VHFRRWNPELIGEHGKGGMETWWPGKCCPRTVFHTWWDCNGKAITPTIVPPMLGARQNYSKPRVYTPYRPFDGVDRKKWPQTFSTLMLFFYGPEWHSMTRWVETPADRERWKTYDYDY
jgi:hypothetical protein